MTKGHNLKDPGVVNGTPSADDQRSSGDSRKWKSFTVEPNAAIQSTLEFCNLCQYLDLILRFTQNNKNVFMSMDRSDLKGIGIDNEDHCKEIESAIHLIGGKQPKRKPVTLNEKEAQQIVKNVNENLQNLDLGMYLFMDDLIKKRPNNYFVSETSDRTAGHDALEFVRTTKQMYKHLVQYLHQKQIITDKDFKVIMNQLSQNPPSKRNRLKAFAWAATLGSAIAIGYLFFTKPLR